MNATNILLKTIIAVLLAALAGHPIAKAQSKKIIVRIESDSAIHDTFRINLPQAPKISKIEPVIREFHHYFGFLYVQQNPADVNTQATTGTVDPIPMEKSKLVANYIGVPLAIGWQSNPSRWETSESDGSTTSYNETPKFSIKAGIHTGYLISSHAKLKESGGNTTKQYDDFNLNNFIVAPFINLEYEDLGLYMRYPLTNMFKTGQGANSQCLQFGITLKFT